MSYKRLPFIFIMILYYYNFVNISTITLLLDFFSYTCYNNIRSLKSGQSFLGGKGVRNMLIDFETERKKREKERLSVVLDNLFWEDPVAYVQLCDFCESHTNKIDPDIKKKLIELGLLNSDGSLPDSTNELVYEATTGLKPFWLD